MERLSTGDSNNCSTRTRMEILPLRLSRVLALDSRKGCVLGESRKKRIDSTAYFEGCRLERPGGSAHQALTRKLRFQVKAFLGSFIVELRWHSKYCYDITKYRLSYLTVSLGQITYRTLIIRNDVGVQLQPADWTLRRLPNGTCFDVLQSPKLEDR